MSVLAPVKADPYEEVIVAMIDAMKSGLSIKADYDGLGAKIDIDERGLKKIALLAKEGKPLEEAIGVDISKMLTQLAGETLAVTIEAKGIKVHMEISGPMLVKLREASADRLIDSKTSYRLAAMMDEILV